MIHHFSGAPSDGRNPRTALLLASDHRLYGTTHTGGTSNVGTLFVLNQNGGGYGLLHSFTGTQGANPRGPLVEAPDGALYGTTYGGGSSNLGTFFKINKDGSGFTVVHHFNEAVWGQPWLPQAGLTLGADGALFGTTSGGGNLDLGTVTDLEAVGFPAERVRGWLRRYECVQDMLLKTLCHRLAARSSGPSLEHRRVK